MGAPDRRCHCRPTPALGGCHVNPTPPDLAADQAADRGCCRQVSSGCSRDPTRISRSSACSAIARAQRGPAVPARLSLAAADREPPPGPSCGRRGCSTGEPAIGQGGLLLDQSAEIITRDVTTKVDDGPGVADGVSPGRHDRRRRRGSAPDERAGGGGLERDVLGGARRRRSERDLFGVDRRLAHRLRHVDPSGGSSTHVVHTPAIVPRALDAGSIIVRMEMARLVRLGTYDARGVGGLLHPADPGTPSREASAPLLHATMNGHGHGCN